MIEYFEYDKKIGLYATMDETDLMNKMKVYGQPNAVYYLRGRQIARQWILPAVESVFRRLRLDWGLASTLIPVLEVAKTEEFGPFSDQISTRTTKEG